MRTGECLSLRGFWPLLLVLGTGCHRAPAPVTINLVDRFHPDAVLGRVQVSSSQSPRLAWRFDTKEHPRFEGVLGVEGLEVRDGRLQGKTTSAKPVVHLEAKLSGDPNDTLEEVEIGIRISAGTNVSAGLSGEESLQLNDPRLRTENFFIFRSPAIPGTELRTYLLHTTRGIPMSRARHVLVRPTDVPGAHFEIDSVRLISRKEFLRSVPSGISWQGLSEIYRESIIARTPESIRFPVDLPKHPWLDLAIGTPEVEPVTFRIAVGARGRERVVLERTVTTPHRWDPASVNLREYAGRHVLLTFSVLGGKSGLLGFWGAPAVRTAGVMPLPSAPHKSRSDPPQGVVLVWVDTLRRDHLDVYDYARETGPAVRRMAAEGTLFRDEVVQATWTKVSTPSVLTSLYPATHGVHDFSDRLPSSAITLAKLYREAGYATLSMSSGLFTGRFTNLHQGFEEVQENGSIKGELRTSKTARVFVDRLLPWLERHREVPFFVFLHVQDPHDPYKPNPPYDALFVDASLAEEHERQAKAAQSVIADPVMKAFLMPSRDELLKAGLAPDAYVGYEQGWYDGAIRGMDAEIQRLLEGLRNLGLDRRTLVVFTADHGEEFLEHGKMFHGQSTYGELSNVPLIFWRPGSIPAGAVIGQTVQEIDIMPTLLETSRIRVPPSVQGHSLLPLIQGATPASGVAQAATAREWPAIIEKAATHEGGGPPPRDAESYAILVDGWKLIHNVHGRPGVPEYELYDHRKDPLDSRNASAEHPEIVQRLASQLESWHRMAEGARLPTDAKSTQGLSQEELERLRALGYIQ